VTISLEDPLGDLANNVVGTVHVLEAARRHGIPVASCATVHVYGNWLNAELREADTRYLHDAGPIREDARTMDGYLTPLHGSKASAEHYVRVYASALRRARRELPADGDLRTTPARRRILAGSRTSRSATHRLAGHVLRHGRAGARPVLYATDAAQAFVDFAQRGEGRRVQRGRRPGARSSLLECLRCDRAASGSQDAAALRAGALRRSLSGSCDVGARATPSAGSRGAPGGGHPAGSCAGSMRTSDSSREARREGADPCRGTGQAPRRPVGRAEQVHAADVRAPADRLQL
jgi:hypothetical protein